MSSSRAAAAWQRGAQWAEMIRNRHVQFVDMNLFPMSSEGRKWTSKLANTQQSAQVKRLAWSKRMSVCCARMTKRWGKWPRTQRVHFTVIQPTVRRSLTEGWLLVKLLLIRDLVPSFFSSMRQWENVIPSYFVYEYPLLTRENYLKMKVKEKEEEIKMTKNKIGEEEQLEDQKEKLQD